MGNAASAKPAPVGPGSPDQKVAKKTEALDASARVFDCAPMVGLASAPPVMKLKLDHEALTLLDSASLDVVRTFSFHRILCWGWTPTSFQWRAYTDDTEMDVLTFVVRTASGETVEAAMMKAVQELMKDMQVRGVPDAEFVQLINTLQLLADEGESDSCLAAVRQFALGRAFNARQAAAMVQTMGALSPFDKLECAVALFPTLMSRESFQIVLGEFEDGGDRDNILHRLQLQQAIGGELSDTPGRKRKAAM